MKASLRVFRTWSGRYVSDVAAGCVWLFAVAGLEFLGRDASTDLRDALALCYVSGLITLTGLWHRRAPLNVAKLVDWASKVFARIKAALDVEMGVDFRRTPPLPFGVPKALWIPAVACVLGCGVTWVTLDAFPEVLRQIATNVSYTLYLTLLGALWFLTTLSVMVTLVFLFTLVQEFLAGRRGAPAPRVAMVFAGCALLSASQLLPAWVPHCVGAAATLLSVLALLSPFAQQALIFRTKDPTVPVRTLGFRLCGLILVAKVFTFPMCLILLMSGNPWRGDMPETMPITHLMGRVLAWTSVPLWVGVAVWTVTDRLRAAWQDPSRKMPPVLHVRGVRRHDRRALRRTLRGHGFRVRWTQKPPRRTDVPVRILASTSREEHGLTTTRDGLLRPAFLDRLRRRHEILCRRALMKGLRRLFKASRRRSFERGSGFWLAPHLTLLRGLSRDQDERVTSDGAYHPLLEQIIGPTFREAIPLRARCHLRTVLDALNVDLIFVEDGVKFSRLRAVLSVLFEVYDVHGGRQRAEERHFVGLLGTAIVIHESEPTNPFTSTVYEAPNYEHIGRARILHVFRDRGEDDVPSPAPVEVDAVPVGAW